MRTWDDCREMSARKARTHSYDDLVDLLIELAMSKEKCFSNALGYTLVVLEML